MKQALITQVLIIVAMVVGFSFGGPSQVVAADTQILQYEYFLPPNVPEYPVIEKFFKGLEEATGGTVKVRLNPGGAMGKADGTYQRTLLGINNIGHINPSFNNGVFPMWEIFHYPVHCNSSYELAKFQIKMFEKGYFDKDFSQVKVIALFNIGSFILFSNKDINVVEDLKGLKVRTPSEGWADTCKALGAVPVTLPTSEMYVGLQKGIVDAVANIWDAAHTFKLGEVSKVVNELYLITSTHIQVMNKKTWEKLPPEGKAYIDANWKQYSLDMAKTFDDGTPKFKEDYLANGPDRVFRQFPQTEIDKMEKLMVPVWDKFISAREAKGLPAKKALNELYKMMSEAGVKNPIIGYTPN